MINNQFSNNKIINKNKFITYEDVFNDIYISIRQYFSSLLKIDQNKVFYIGYQETLQNLYQKTIKDDIKTLPNMTPPFQSIDFSEFNFDRTKTSYSLSNLGVEVNKFKNYHLFIQWLPLQSSFTIHIFPQNRTSLLQFIQKMFGTFNIPINEFQIKYQMSKTFPQYSTLSKEDKILIDKQFDNIIQNFYLSMSSLNDSSNYDWGTDLRILQIDGSFDLQGYIPIKFMWTDSIENIDIDEYKIL